MIEKYWKQIQVSCVYLSHSTKLWFDMHPSTSFLQIWSEDASNLYSTDKGCFCAWDFTNNTCFSLHEAHRLASSDVAVWPPRARLDMEHAVPGMVCQAGIKKPCLGSPLCSWSHQLHLHEMLSLWNSQCLLFWRPLLQLKSFNDEKFKVKLLPNLCRSYPKAAPRHRGGEMLTLAIVSTSAWKNISGSHIQEAWIYTHVIPQRMRY